MAFGSTAAWNVTKGGADGTAGNGGGFDASQTAGMLTDGAATAANTASPVFSSVSYNFAAGDVNAWVYIASGTNWIPGWYKIVSVAANKATLDAAIGNATLKLLGLSTALGCAAVASPTAATWSIDYSRQDSQEITYSDLTAAGAGSTFTSAGHPFGKQQVGNIIAVSSGTNCTVQRVAIASVSGTTATFDKAVTTGVTSNGAGKLGGALLTVGQAGALMVGSNIILVKYNASPYVSTSTTINVAAGRLQLAAGTTAAYSTVRGYDVVPGDETGNRPTLQWGVGPASNPLITTTSGNCGIENLILDGNRANFTSTRGINATGNNSLVRKVLILSCSATAISLGAQTSAIFIDVEISDCTGTAAVLLSTGTCAWFGLTIINCAIHGMSGSTARVSLSDVLIENITGAGNTGIQMTGNGQITADEVTIYSVASHGWDLQALLGGSALTNCYVEAAGGWGWNIGVTMDTLALVNCAGNTSNTSGNYQTANINQGRVINFQSLTTTAFNNASGFDFSPNSVATGGALLRGAAFPQSYGDLSTNSQGDIGAVQHGNAPPFGGVLLHGGRV